MKYGVNPSKFKYGYRMGYTNIVYMILTSQGKCQT